MSNLPRVLVAGTALLAAGSCFAAPALASGRPAATPTRLTVHAVKGSVAPKKQDPLVVHLDTARKGLEGEASALTLVERSVHAAGTKSAWTDVTDSATITDAGGGTYVITGVRPNDPKVAHGHKDQFQVRFAGDATHRHSHSGVITVVVRPARTP